MDKHNVARAFATAAAVYDGVADLQRASCRDLLRAITTLVQPSRVLDLGSGTGYGVNCMQQCWPSADYIAMDIAFGMLQHIALNRASVAMPGLVVADADNIPLADTSIDLVFSNMVVQWCDDLLNVFQECLRVLRPDGCLALTSFGPQTLKELRTAWAAADSYQHVNTFVEMSEVESLARRAGFELIRCDALLTEVHYESVDNLMRTLKDLGAHNITSGRPRHLQSRQGLEKMRLAYQKQMPKAGQTSASYEIISLIAKKVG